MDKLISQQAAIDALCKSECGWNNAECRHKDDTDFCVTCDNVKIIKSLPSAQPEQRWIPVTERLPEDSCGCLVTVLSKDGLRIVLPSIYTKYDPKETFSVGGSGRVVEAWKPYPEPYQERNEDI